MIRKPVPDIVLQSMSCSCKKSSCKTHVCYCTANSLRCTELCQCLNCENRKEEEKVDSSESDDEADDDNESDSGEESEEGET